MAANAEAMLLVITGSHDSTIDYLLQFLDSDRVFRLNTDLLLDYELVFDDSGFVITDPAGRGVTSDDVYKAFWRWPEWPLGKTTRERYTQGELRYLLREIANLLWSQDKFVLVEPTAPRRSGKLLQLTRAREFFNVPPFRAVLNSPPVTTGPEVIKSLAKELPEGQNIFSTRVDPSALALRYPWFMQQYIDAVADVTVLVIRHRLFAFELERDFLETSIDWREIPGKCSAWKPMELQETTRDAIHRYMESILLGFGRLDFLRDHNGDLQFCEVNPNPQFAWLGLDDASGIRSAILEEISPLTKRHAIPSRHPLARSREATLR